MHEFNGLRVLAAGAAGFVGANLIRELLRHGAEVHALVRPSGDQARLQEIRDRLQIHDIDLADHDLLRKKVRAIAPEFIFFSANQRAAATEQGRWQQFQVNVASRMVLLEAAREFQCKAFVSLGTSLEYGASQGPMRESDPLAPRNFYGATMAAATLMGREFARLGVPVVMLRPFIVYGPRDIPKRLVPSLFRAARTGEGMSLTAPGVRRDWVYIDDVVEACMRAALRADSLAGEVINIGAGRLRSTEEVVAAVEAATGRRIETRVGEYPRRSFDMDHWVADVSKARDLLGWQPRHALEDGIERTAAWYRSEQ